MLQGEDCEEFSAEEKEEAKPTWNKLILTTTPIPCPAVLMVGEKVTDLGPGEREGWGKAVILKSSVCHPPTYW